ncbi:hypothetical protein [Streptomyces sp. NPDC058268]|uniref:hypothetical protein n=1 Tax=Streptomyces sp. NPDC058268 TaxID=3346413 RepID=UPI0036E7305D
MDLRATRFPFVSESGWFNSFRWEPGLYTGFSPVRFMVSALKVALLYVGYVLIADYATRSGLLQTIYQPVTGYLRTSSAGLPMNANALVNWWAALGIGTFLASGLVKSTPARLAWTGWGAATTAMVWAGTAGPGRTVAAGLTALTWAAASLLALRARG